MSEEKTGSGLPEAWRVELPVFEGPLDLLLHLVRVNEVEIADIPVTLVCDQFHEYLQLMEELNLDIAAEYIYEAALLIYLKSRMLLPRSSEDESTEEDPRRQLVERLLEYRRIKEAAQALGEIHGVRRGIWTRPAAESFGEEEEEDFEVGDLSLFDLLGALREALRRYDYEHPKPLMLSGETFGVREQFERMLGVLGRGKPLDLIADLRQRSCRAEVVAAFLAVLELARLSLIRLHQTESGELILHRTRRKLQAHELEAIPA